MKRPERRCIYCDSPLPRGSRATRRYCSTSCRVREWHRRNQAPPPDPRLDALYAKGPRGNRKHYHVTAERGIRFLVGHAGNAPWFGDVCPPECPGLAEGEGYEPMEEFWRPFAREPRTH